MTTAPGAVSATGAPAAAAADPRTERKRTITRWNRRLGWVLIVSFPFSYLAAWLHTQHPDGALGSWLSLLNIGSQVVGTLILAAHAAYSFYVFGFPPPRLSLRTLNGYAAYVVLFVYLLSQSIGDEPMHTVLEFSAFAAIGLHVVVAITLSRKRPNTGDPTTREDTRALLDPDAEVLDHIVLSRADRPAETAAPALVARGLDVALGEVQVLFGVDLVVQPGETVALLGNNGAGKTTTLRTLAGLQKPFAGAVELDGFDVTRLTPAGRAALGTSLVTGGNAVFGPLTVEENLRLLAGRIDDLPEAELRARLARASEAFPWIAERSGQPASTLSGGEQQMLAVAHALVVAPKVLLIDEFSLGLAPKIVGQLMELIPLLNAQGTAVLLVEQSANVALSVASRVYVMERGRIVLAEAADALRADPQRLTDALVKGADAAVTR